jgi:predicted ATPase
VLDEALRAASSAAGLSTVEIVGEAGIGKTTLLEWLGASAARAGALVLSGRCSEFERDVPYALWIDALDSSLVVAPDLPEDDLVVLGSVFPALRWFATGAPVERHQLHRAVRAVLERLAAPRGLVLL